MTDYYHQYYSEFFWQTVDIDPSSFLTPFVNAIPTGISILDVGCGSGRDLLWLKKQGFDVTGFEKSAGLANLAAEHAGCKVIKGDFETYDFSTISFDAILASGSLVHVPHENLPLVLANIIPALKSNPSGEKFMYISLKAGTGIKKDFRNRTFYLWNDETLKSLFANLGFKIIHTSKSRSLKNSKDLWMGYILKIYSL